MKLFSLLLTLFITCASAQDTQPKPDTDWEGALADYMQAKGQAEIVGLWVTLQRPDPAVARKRWDFFAAQFPTSSSTAKLASTRCAELVEAKRWDELLTAVTELVRRHPDYPSTHGPAIAAVEKIVTKAEVPEEMRLKALRALVPLVKNRALVVRACMAPLTKMNLPEDARYRLACELEESCGPSALMREFRWRAVERLALSATPDAVRAACEAFSKRYGGGHLEARSAERLLLTLEKTPEAKKRLAEMAKEDKATTTQLKAALTAIQQALAKGDAAELKAALASLAAIRPAHVAEATWTALVQSKEFLAAPVASQRALLESLFAHTQAGAAQAAAISVCINLGRHQPAILKLAVKHLVANASDAQQAFGQFGLFQRFARDAKDEDLLRKTYRAGAGMAEKLGVTDREVDYLTEFAQLIWDRDEAAARDALKRAVAHWPRIPAAAQAGWFLAFLEGKLGVVQGALPRAFKPAANADAPMPVLPMPKKAEPASPCVVRGDAVEMAKADGKQNLIAAQTAMVSDADATTRAVTDGDAKTRWQPAKLPAVLTVPLSRISTVERIRAHFTTPTYYTITLRDAEGRALAKVERDWGFWEQMRIDIHWPEADATLNLTPVPGVAAIEVQVFEGIGEVGLVELEAFSSPYPATALHEFATQEIEAGAKRVRVTLDAAQPEVTTTLHADKESTRGFPIMRWLKPWTRSAQPVVMRTLRENIGIEFWGDSATATISGAGGARWSLDGQPMQESAPLNVKDKTTRELAIGGKTSGRHLLRLQSTNVPAARDEGGFSNVSFHQLSVKGRAAVRPLLRFLNDKGESGEWQQPADDGSAAVPEKVRGGKTARVQVAAFFDSRGAAGTATATVRGMKLAFDKEPAAPAADFASHAASAFPEQLDAVLAGVREREAVVVYAKMGTAREHAAAKALAERAGLYLVSDDIGLNMYSSPVIVIGTPLRHRYCRQLLATAGLWNDATYLNDEDGVIGIERDEKGRPSTYHLTGETPDAVVKAVERLLAKLPPRTEAPVPFRTFASHTLEMIYPWQLHGQRKTAAVEVRLGIQDRRSAQFGIAAEVALDAVSIECGALTSSSGKTIPKVLVQTVGNYEWVPFFGDLRLPNLLMPNATFSLPARSAMGVWLTAITDATTPAGEYRGDLKITAAGQTQTVPVRVVVEPIRLPNTPEIGTYSFAATPYWFHQGTKVWERALRELAANEAAQDVNTVSPVFHTELKPARHSVPVEMAVGPADSRADSLKWQPHSADAKDIAAGSALFMRFAKPVPMREIAAVLKPAEDARFILAAASATGEWTAASEPTRQLCATWDERNRPRSQAQPEVLRFKVKPAMTNAAIWRITTQKNGAFTAHSAIALTAEDDRWPFTADFSHFDEQMTIYEEEYRAQQRPLPVFLSQIHADAIQRMSTDLFGTSGAVGDTAAWFAEMMVEHLGKTGRAKRFIAKVGDEPRDLVRWAQFAQPYRDGGLQTMTAHNTSYADMNVGSGLINPWCPNYEHEVWKPFFHERRKQGDKVWWYECGIPATRITGSPVENMPFYWLTAKWRMDGAMNYAALHANKGSSMPLAFRYEHGMDHRMAHEKNGRLLDTTRRELEGDGIRDVKLITWVRHRIEALKPAHPDRAKQLEQRLDAAIESVAPYRYGYPQDAELWHRARNTVYDLAVEVAK